MEKTNPYSVCIEHDFINFDTIVKEEISDLLKL